MSNPTEALKKTVEDEDLKYVILCQNGDTEAFEILVERHQKRMLNIAYRMLGDYHEACDVAQDAFVAAFKSIRKFKAESKFSTWLYRIIVNYSKNRLKELQVINKREGLSMDASGEIELKGVLDQSLIHENNPGIDMEMREREAHVQKCIMLLDDEFREVLVLRDIQGFSYEEISDMLNIADGTVKSRLSRARNALKDCLSKVIGDL